MSRLTTAPIEATRRVLSTGPVNAIVRRLGLESALAAAYWRLAYRAAGGTCTQTVRDASVSFRASSVSEFRHYRTLVNERAVVADLLGRLDDGDPFWDVGAYVGAYTCLAAASPTAGPVTAFEPRDPWAERIEANLAANDLEADVERVALAEDAGESNLAVDDVARLDAETVAGDAEAGSGEAVRTVSGDAYRERSDGDVPAAVKVDVEGAEARVLRGMRETLAHPDCRFVYCEVHPSLLPEFGGDEDEVESLLTDREFAVDRFHDRGSEYFLRAEKRPDESA